MLFLRLFGGVAIESEAGPLTGPAARRHRLALLALLALAHPRAVSRDKLVAYLWPERDAERGRNLLNQAVHALRRTLGDGAILSTGDDLRLDDDYTRCDVVAFEQAIAAGELERAVALHAGPFVDGFFLPGAPEFERWVEGERERLRLAYGRALEELAEAARVRGDAAGAIEWWRRLAAEEPYSARVTLGLMEALQGIGDRAGALRQARLHAARMKEEFDAEPDVMVAALAERLRREPACAEGEPYVAGLWKERRAEAVATGPPAASESNAAGPGGGGVAAGTLSRRRRRRLVAALAIAAVVPLLAALALWGRIGPEPDSQRIVVAEFENRTGDPALDPIGTMTADWIAQGLAHAGIDQVVSIEMRMLGEEMGAATVISGAFYREGEELRIQARLSDARSLRVLSVVGPIGGRVETPVEAVAELGQRVLSAAAQHFDRTLHAPPGVFSRPPTYAAYQEYLAVVERSHVRDWHGVLEHARRAAELDTTWVFPLLTMATAYANLGDDARADSMTRILEPLRDLLTPHGRARLELITGWTRGDRIMAYEASLALARIAPGARGGVQVAFEAYKLRRPREAVRVLSRLDTGSDELRTNSWYWDVLGRAHHHLGDHRQELRVAREARTHLPTNPFALAIELRALAALGRAAEVERRATEHLRSPERRAAGTGEALATTGLELRAHGHPEAAGRLFDQAIAWYEARVAEEPESPADRAHLAELLYLTGRWEEARRIFEVLADREPEDPVHRGFLGRIAAHRGDHAAAEAAARWLEEHPSRYNRSERSEQRAMIAAILGDRAAATELLREAFTRGLPYHVLLHVQPDFDSLRDYPPFRELMRPEG